MPASEAAHAKPDQTANALADAILGQLQEEDWANYEGDLKNPEQQDRNQCTLSTLGCAH